MVSLRALVAAIVCVAVPVVAVTPQQVLERLGDLTSETKALEAPAQSITGKNAGLINVSQGPVYDVTSGLYRVIFAASMLTSEVAYNLEGTPTTDDATGIASAYQELANAQIDLIKILSAKSYVVFLATGVGQRMADALKRDQTTLNELSEILANELPDQGTEIRNAFGSLNDKLVLTILAYQSGL